MDAHHDTAQLAAERSANTTMKIPRRVRRTVKPVLLTRDQLDGRTITAKAFDALVRDIEADLGGHDQLSTIERNLVEGFAGAAAVLADLNCRLALGERIDLGEHAQCVNALVKIASRLGLQRRQRDVMTLDRYLASLNPETPEAAE
jgi:hypothetical protein